MPVPDGPTWRYVSYRPAWPLVVYRTACSAWWTFVSLLWAKSDSNNRTRQRSSFPMDKILCIPWFAQVSLWKCKKVGSNSVNLRKPWV